MLAESFIEKLPWILATLLGLSEALAHIPALKSNSVLPVLMSIFKKAKNGISGIRFMFRKKVKPRKNPGLRVKFVNAKNKFDGLDPPIKKSRIIDLKDKNNFY